MYKSYFTESFPYIKNHTASDEFNVERLLSLTESELLKEGLVRIPLEEDTEKFEEILGAVGSLLGKAAAGTAKLGMGAAKMVGKGALAVGKVAGKALLAAVKAAVTSVGKDILAGIKKTATKYTPQLLKFSAGTFESVSKKFQDKLAEPKGLETNVVPVVNELFNELKPTLSKIASNPEMNEQAWINFMGILTLDYLQQVVAPTLASQEGQEPDLNLIKGLSQSFQKALVAKMQPLMKKKEEPKEKTPKVTADQFKFEPVTASGATTSTAAAGT